MNSAGRVIAVSRSATHNFSKPNEPAIRLMTGRGVAGDAHWGETVQHLVRLREDPTKPNLRQVHLIHAELFDELRAAGFHVAPGQIGENITTTGIDLLGLPKDARLHLGASAVVQITGLRNPCKQLDGFQPGLMTALLGRDAQGRVTLKSGIMGIVLEDGEVRPGDGINVQLPPEPHERLTRV
ncbi:MAG TPA: MOSC domain-containing protein [Micropepsaceae bacterium]|jgi:MOSC domain-containing protein YiiM|nr:MOSC domain-containing protein [Micropepsaceae bacterium]